MIPVAWDEVAALALGALEPARGGGEVPTITGIKADSRLVGPGDLFVALNTGVDTWPRQRREAQPRSSPTTRRPRSRPLPRSSARRARRGSSPSWARPARRRRRTSSARSAAPPRRRSGRRRARTTRSACRSRSAGSSRTPSVLVTEMGMRGLGQIAALCAVARPYVAIVTSIGPEHLELVGTVERVAQANAEAIAALPRGRDRGRTGRCSRARSVSRP